MRNIKSGVFVFFVIFLLFLILIIVNFDRINTIIKRTLPEQTSFTHNALQKSPAAALSKKKITALSPNSGSIAGGDLVVITGTGLSNAMAVTFGGVNATITANSATSITVTTPSSNGNAGSVDVAVTKSDGSTITLGEYNYILVPPTIDGISPSSGSTSGGDVITIKGNNLLNATRVTFDEASGKIVKNTTTAITVKTPSHTNTGRVDITVNTAGGSVTDARAYDYLLLPPVIHTISPNSGSTEGGNAITLLGSYLSYPESVTFDGESAAIIKNDSDSITVTAPLHTLTGAVDVAVTTSGGTTTNSGAYTYLIPPPTISRLSVTSGSILGGDSIIIYGTHLANANSVTFDGMNAAITDNTRHKIVVSTPPHNIGAASIVVNTKGGSVTSSEAFLYVSPIPSITGVSPDVGPTTGGASITIRGTNFVGATGISFGGINTTSFSVNDSGTVITAVAPPHNAGTVDIAITTAGGTSATNNKAQYTYVVPAPVIFNITPLSGLTTGGTSVSILGSNLSATSAVLFGGLSASFYVVSSTEIVATAPAMDGAEIVAIEVITSGGSAVSPQNFTYILQFNTNNTPYTTIPNAAQVPVEQKERN